MRIKILPILLLLSLPSCSYAKHPTSSYPEHDYSEVSDLVITYDQSFSINEKDHYIYFFQENCHNCEELKNEVIEFALKKYIDFYFVIATSEIPHNYDFQDINKTLKSNDINDVFVGVTPQLVLIKEGKIEKSVIKNIFIEEELSRYYS